MFNEDSIMTYEDFNYIEEKIALLTSRIRELGETKTELLYDNNEIYFENDKIYVLEEG